MPSSLLSLLPQISSINQRLPINFKHGIQVFLKREDLLHPLISGNKYRKLKYNLDYARGTNQQTLLTFGGAYSNHIAAVAAAGYTFGFQTIGIIRGEELASCFMHNPTLRQAYHHGMQFKFISRALYQQRHCSDFIQQLHDEFGQFYLIPEGGTNLLAIQGCKEILTDYDCKQFNVICCAVGTGGTIAGLIEASRLEQQVLGFSSLKGSFLADEIKQWTSKTNWQLLENYHFGGYAKTTSELLNFINDFEQQTQIKIEPIYTAKMLYGLFDLIQQDYFPRNSQILAIHTGGLQGNKQS